MSTLVYDGYWTLVFNPRDGGYTLGTYVVEHTVINYFGDTLTPQDPDLSAFDTPPGMYYFGYVDEPGGTVGVAVTSSAFGRATVLYSNNPGIAFPNEKMIIQQATWSCLLAGTGILTPDGDRPVQDLRPGDQVVTRGGELATVRWVGRQSAITLFAGPAATPVLIRAGALGEGVPTADLYVSQDHAICIDGILANAHALINGTTILLAPETPAQLDYYHVELDRHRLIVANGTFVESFVDDVSRQGFDNVDEWLALDLPALETETLPHAKAKSARQLPASTRARLAARADRLGSPAETSAFPTADSMAELLT